MNRLEALSSAHFSVQIHGGDLGDGRYIACVMCDGI